jgi:hypothetical protein
MWPLEWSMATFWTLLIDVVGGILALWPLFGDSEARPAAGRDDESSTRLHHHLGNADWMESLALMIEQVVWGLGNPDSCYYSPFLNDIAYAATFERKVHFTFWMSIDAQTLKPGCTQLLLDSPDYLYPMKTPTTSAPGGEDADDDGNTGFVDYCVWRSRTRIRSRFSDTRSRMIRHIPGSQGRSETLRYIRGVDRLIMPVSIYNYQQPKKKIFEGTIVCSQRRRMSARYWSELPTKGGYGEDIVLTPSILWGLLYCALYP